MAQGAPTQAAASAADVMRAKYALLDCARWVAGGGSSDEAAKVKLPSLVDALKELVPPAEAKPAGRCMWLHKGEAGHLQPLVRRAE